VDLITVTDCRGMSDEEEPRFDSRLFPDMSRTRCKMFPGKKACRAVLYLQRLSLLACHSGSVLSSPADYY